MNFSERLKELRKEKKMTQEELASRLYVSRSLIAKYECGSIYPTKENIEKIALFFGLQISDLVDAEEAIRISLDNHNCSLIVNRMVTLLGIIICSLYLLLFFIPVLKGFEYVYPIPDGQFEPAKTYFCKSIFQATIENGNPIGVTCFIFCLINIIFGIICLIKEKSRFISINRFINYGLLVTNIFLIFISIIVSCSYVL